MAATIKSKFFLGVNIFLMFISFIFFSCNQIISSRTQETAIKPSLKNSVRSYPTSSREAFTLMDNITGVYAIDEYYSAIFPKTNFSGKPTVAFYNEFDKLCRHYGRLDYKHTYYDPLTEKNKIKIIPASEKPLEILRSLTKPWLVRGAFELSEILTYKIPHKNVLQVLYWSTSREKTDTNGIPILATSDCEGKLGYHYKIRGFIIKHNKPQPYLFKSECIKNINNIQFKKEDGNLATKLPEIFSERVLWQKLPRNIADLFQALTAYAKKEKGTYKWVVYKTRNDYQAFIDIQCSQMKYIRSGRFTGGTIYYPTWYFGFKSPHEKFVIKHKMDKYWIYFNRTIEELH